MSLDSDRLLKLAKTLEDDEAELFVEWVLDTMEGIGLDHKEMCAISRPHSHSADCDCGAEELGYKINRILKGE